MVAKVTCWTNGMVTAFNEQGEQVTEYQGRFENVKDKIVTLDPEPEFTFGKWKAWVQPVTKVEWLRRMGYPEPAENKGG